MAREIPQYISQLGVGSMPTVQYNTSQGNATMGVSKELFALGSDIQQKNKELVELRAKSTIQTKFNELYLQHQSDPAALKQSIDGFKKGFIENIGDSELAQKLDITYDVEAMPYYNKALVQSQKNTSEELKKQRIQTVYNNTDSIRLVAPSLYDPRPEIRKEAGRSLQLKRMEIEQAITAKEIDGSFTFDPLVQEKILRSTMDEVGKQTTLAWFDSQPDKLAAYEQWKSGGVKFKLPNEGAPVIAKAEDAINYVIDNFEIDPANPDKIVNDGKGLAKYGINTAANPNVDIQNLTREQAAQIYKKEYWDKLGADSLPENMRLIAYDTAVNFGVGQAKKMLAEAGNDPQKLAELRKQRHNELVTANPEKYGQYQKSWAARDEHFMDVATQDISANPREFMTTDGLESLDKEIGGMTKQYLAQLEKFQKEQEKAMEITAGVNMINDAILGKAVIDPTDKNTEKYLNLAIDNNPNITLPEMRQAAESTGIVPNRLKTQISSMLLNGDAQQQIVAADVVSQMLDSKSNLNTGLSEAALAKAVMINRSISAGVPQDVAVQMANDSVKPQNIEVQNYRKSQITETKNPFKFDSVAGQFTEFFATNPSIPDAMKAEYEASATDFFVKYGVDADTAKDLALKSIKKKWAETTIDGKKRMMKYAPESQYSVQGIDNAWMREQLLSDIKSIPAIYADESELSNRLDNIIIQPNPKTISSPNGVMYDVFETMPDGTLSKVFGEDGRPVLFKPDFKESPLGKKLLSETKTPEQYIKEARQKQMEMDEALTNPISTRNALTTSRIGTKQ